MTTGVGTGLAVRRIGVTGAAGFVGRYVVRELAAAGYDVVGVDRRAPAAWDARVGPFRSGDLLDRAAVPALLGDCDAVVHLAARPSPECGTAEEVFGENVRTTEHVLELAEARGMARVVLASSECAVGYVFGRWPFPLDYLPIDEAHPLRPEDPYGRSKQVCEELAAAASVRSGMVTVALRLSLVVPLDAMTRRAWARKFHWPASPHPSNFWNYVDARDAARAFRRAVEAPLAGFEAMFVAARESRHCLPTRDLLRHYWPADHPLLANLAGHCSLLDTTKAERLLGWTAEHSWRELGTGWSDVRGWMSDTTREWERRLSAGAGLVRRLVRQARREARGT